MALKVEDNKLIFSQHPYQTHLNVKSHLVEDFKLKIQCTEFEIIRTKNINGTLEDIKLNIFGVSLVSSILNLETNKPVPSFINLQFVIESNIEDAIQYKMNFLEDRINMNIIMRDTTILEELVRILEENNRPKILNISLGLQGVRGLYSALESFDMVTSKKIDNRFDIGVLLSSLTIISGNEDLKELVCKYANDLNYVYRNPISFSITDTIKNDPQKDWPKLN